MSRDPRQLSEDYADMGEQREALAAATLNADGNLADRPDVIWLFSGDQIRPLDPDPARMHIVDIAHALSLQCRFTGHTRTFYSVAEHCVLCAEMVAPQFKREALLHDGTEAYLADIARPVKQAPGFGEVYREAERKLEIALAFRFGLTWPWPEAVKEADNAMLAAEIRCLMPSSLGAIWPETIPTPEPKGWLPAVAEDRFLLLASELEL